jgi:two-component system, chemotaxis family, protein-glutamate methylesterase/glutaminase
MLMGEGSSQSCRNMLPIHAKPSGVDVVAIGASAGGVEALSELLSQLPGNLGAAVLVVMHRDPERASHLLDILSRKSKLKVEAAKEGDRLSSGICFVGTPNEHLTIGPGLRVHLVPDHFYRSHNVDALFHSLARNAGNRTIGVVLSGMLKDGTLGLKAIKEAGGKAFVQSPEEAAYPEMPRHAIQHAGRIDLIAPVSKLADEIVRISARHKLVVT